MFECSIYKFTITDPHRLPQIVATTLVVEAAFSDEKPHLLIVIVTCVVRQIPPASLLDFKELMSYSKNIRGYRVKLSQRKVKP